jgi:hypothetical protein
LNPVEGGRERALGTLAALRVLLDPTCRLRATTKLVAIAIAQHLDADGVAWPGTARIMQMTSLSRTTVVAARRELRASGIFKIEDPTPTTGRKSVTYFFDPPVSPDDTVPLSDTVSYSDTVPPNGTTVSPDDTRRVARRHPPVQDSTPPVSPGDTKLRSELRVRTPNEPGREHRGGRLTDDAPRVSAPRPTDTVVTFPCSDRISGVYHLSRLQLALLQEEHPGVNVLSELPKAYTSIASRGAVPKSSAILPAFRRWLRNEVPRA